MGHRANYVLIEQGIPTLYYSHWGAKSIPEMLLSGFASTWQSIQNLTACTELLTISRAEGGVLVDRDHRRLLFWGGEGINYTPYLRRPFLSALSLLWSNWTVEWGMHGSADLADALHLDSATVLFGDFEEGFDPVNPLSDEELLDNMYESTLITVKWQEGVVHDYRLRYLPGSILSVGPHLLDVLLRKKPDTLPHERDEEFEGGAFLDLATHTMWVWNRSKIDPRYLTALTQLWAGWDAIGHVDGIVQQITLSGRDPSSIMVPQDEAVTELIKELTQDGPRMPSLTNLIAGATLNVPEATDRQIAPGYFSVPEQILSVEERRQLLWQLFHASS